MYCFSKNDERACSLSGYLRGRPVYVPRGHAPSADGLCIDWRDSITKTTRLDGPCNLSNRETCAVLSSTRSSPNVPAPLGYAPCCVANLAAPSFRNRDEKAIATMTWHFMWQRLRLKNHLEAPLKPSLGINPGRNGPVIKSNDSNTTEFFCKQYCTYLLPGLWRGFVLAFHKSIVPYDRLKSVTNCQTSGIFGGDLLLRRVTVLPYTFWALT